MKKNFLKIFISSLLALSFIFSIVACSKEQPVNINVSVKQGKVIDYSVEIGDLAKNGKSDYTIIYSANAGEAVKQAAKEIQNYVLESAGVFVKIAEDDTVTYDKNSKLISLGETSVLRESGIALDYSLLKDDGFYIKSKNSCVFISGKYDKAILYGAYDFIERFLGVRFYAQDYTYVPQADTVKLYYTDIMDNPAFDDRAFYTTVTGHANYVEYSSKLRMTNEFQTIPEKYGGSLPWFNDTTYLGNYVHNTLYYVQPSLYQTSHPEWFFMENGVAAELCHAHIGLNEDGTIDESLEISPVKVMIESLKEFILHSDNRIKYFMIGQMDIPGACRCDGCMELEEKYKRSGMNIRLINAVSDKIVEWMAEEGINRELYICTFAYQYSQDAPVNSKGEPLDSTVIPRDNVIVRIAPIRANNYYGMIDERQNEETRNMMLEWRKVAKKTMIWSYHLRFSYYYTYYPTMQHWQEDLKLYQEMGCQYIFMQCNATIPDWKSNMEAYVASKMLWDPTLNANDLRLDYIRHFYGFLSDDVIDFINNFETNVAIFMQSDNVPGMTLQSGDEFLQEKYYGVQFFEKQFAIINKMYEMVENADLSISEKEEYTKKVHQLKIYPEFMVLYNYNSYYYNDEFGRQEMMKDFFTTCTDIGIRNWREFNGAIQQLKNMWGYKG